MSIAKITASHLSRQAIVYLRQSSAAQVEHKRESTERQYALAIKARELGWPEDRIVVIDEDLGLSAAGTSHDQALPASLPKWHPLVSVLCSASRCRGWRATMPIGTGSLIS